LTVQSSLKCSNIHYRPFMNIIAPDLPFQRAGQVELHSKPKQVKALTLASVDEMIGCVHDVPGRLPDRQQGS
jgi:hypothetical protein